MSQDQKQRLATKIVNANREKLMQKLNDFAAGKGVDVHICDCAVFICRGFILPSRTCTSLPLFVCA